MADPFDDGPGTSLRVAMTSGDDSGPIGVGLDRDDEDRLAAPDRIAVLKVDDRDLPAVDLGAVAAGHVHQAAARRVHLDHEVEP